MARSNWIACILALSMISGAGALLASLKDHHAMGKPGVKVGPASLLGEDGTVVAREGVLLPEQVLDSQSVASPVTATELAGLPKDTTFGRRIYRFPDGLVAQLTVVLMGSDRASIHQPEYCLDAQNWAIQKVEHVQIPMDRPVRYDLPVNKLTVAKVLKNKLGQEQRSSGIYTYWFVSGDKVTAAPLSGMMWSIAKSLVEKGEIERWAYVSYFCICPPGLEDAAFEHMKEFIRAATPQFQLVPAHPGSPSSATVRNAAPPAG